MAIRKRKTKQQKTERSAQEAHRKFIPSIDAIHWYLFTDSSYSKSDIENMLNRIKQEYPGLIQHSISPSGVHAFRLRRDTSDDLLYFPDDERDDILKRPMLPVRKNDWQEMCKSDGVPYLYTKWRIVK